MSVKSAIGVEGFTKDELQHYPKKYPSLRIEEVPEPKWYKSVSNKKWRRLFVVAKKPITVRQSNRARQHRRRKPRKR